jgi:hypothetical protein
VSVTVEGNADSMRLSHCWTPVIKNKRNPFRAFSDDTTVSVLGWKDAPLWQQHVSERVRFANVVDFDRDGWNEVVVGTSDRIAVFDRNAKPLWNVSGQGQTLSALFADRLIWGDREGQALAFWSGGGKPSRLELYKEGGRLVASYSAGSEWQNVAVDRPTARHALRIVIASTDRVLVFEPKNIAEGKPTSWPIAEGIARMEIIDHGNEGVRDIAVSTVKGKTHYFDFYGKTLPQ